MRARGRDTLGSPIVKLPQSNRTVAQIAFVYHADTRKNAPEDLYEVIDTACGHWSDSDRQYC